ncbi:hypothetical protein N7455_010474 [Penicillium solitum]|uniref:uncharacterized protein n=1 Tax=Penicillium solitum TaxID=60172 RepID=UPI0032C435BA|nr:hypothetical protein N7455_010474 [Penicillium solitum]
MSDLICPSSGRTGFAPLEAKNKKPGYAEGNQTLPDWREGVMSRRGTPSYLRSTNPPSVGIRSNFGIRGVDLPLYPCLYNPPYWIVVHILVRQGQWVVGLTGWIYYTHIGKARGGYMPCTPVCRNSGDKVADEGPYILRNGAEEFRFVMDVFDTIQSLLAFAKENSMVVGRCQNV